MDETCENCSLPIGTGDTYCGSCGHPRAPVRPAPSPPAPAVTPADFDWPNDPATSIGTNAAVGQATPNEQYLGHRLVYDKVPEDSFDPIGNRRLLRQFFLHALLYLAVYVAGAVVSGLVLLLLAVIGLGFATAFTLWWIGAVIVGLLFLCLFWLVPVPAQLSEWKFFVDGKADVAPATFGHIAWALQRRQTPSELVQVRRLKLAGGEGRDYLEIRRGLFSGLVCCFAYGRDLYVGWTFWLQISPLRCVLMFIARLWQTLLRRGNDLYVSLRYDYARAMREAIHSAAREGVDVAVGGGRPQGQDVMSALPVAVADVDARV